MSLPVSSSAYLYSHFKNVYGTLAPKGESGVSISSLKIIDVLIEQVQRLDGKPAGTGAGKPTVVKSRSGKAAPSAKTFTYEDSRVNSLLERYSQLRTAPAKPANPFAGPSLTAGMLFGIAA